MILEARNISFRYGEKSREILKDFSLKAESTERVGLVAPSGFGKTTLCKILSGYEKPDSGQVLLDGKPLDLITQSQIWHFLMDETEKRKIGMIVVRHSQELLEKVCTRIVDLQKE